MAGYHGYSKSNNAVLAEHNGSYPLSKACKVLAKEHGVTVSHAKQWLESNGTSEWHHTSSRYNQTDYYNTELEQTEIDDLKAFKPIKSVKNSTIKTGKLEYKEWYGTRNHPKCTVRIYEGEYEIVGDWYKFDGMRKKYTNVTEI